MSSTKACYLEPVLYVSQLTKLHYNVTSISALP